jgi:hypothetical protein
MQACHKCLMVWSRQTILEGSEHRHYVTSEYSYSIEPQTREDFAMKHVLRIWHQPFITSRRWHMDDPLKQFSFDPLWHCCITLFKSIACESISRLKRWDRLLTIS